jgi:hypothetical protein
VDVAQARVEPVRQLGGRPAARSADDASLHVVAFAAALGAVGERRLDLGAIPQAVACSAHLRQAVALVLPRVPAERARQDRHQRGTDR